MRLDGLVRLIKSMEFYQLRELALGYLPLMGYANPVLTDGWKDGGADVRLLHADGIESSVVVQVSVQAAGWAGKLRKDIEKARKNYDPSTFIFITSIRVPEAEWAKVATEYRSKNVGLVKADCQALASTFFESHASSVVLDVAGVTAIAAGDSLSVRSPKQEAAYAYLFLSEDASQLRRAVLEHAVLFSVVESGAGESRSSLVASIMLHLALSRNQQSLVESVVDSLLTRGQLVVRDGSLAVGADRFDELISSRRLRQQEMKELGQSLQDLTDRFLPDSRRGRPSGETLLSALGPLLLDASEAVSSSLTHRHASGLFPDSSNRLLGLHALLEESGVASPASRQELLSGLVERASASPIAKGLFAAEIFKTVVALDANHLALALGAGQLPVAVLDASVAMPMLLSVLHEPLGDRMFMSAYRLYAQVTEHGSGLELPSDYLEECAAHLIAACEKYSEIVDEVDFLSRSNNAYVAHYVALRLRGQFSGFGAYVEDLGVTLNILQVGDYHARVRTVSRLLGKTFSDFGVTVVEIGEVSGVAYTDARRELDLASDGGRRRAEVTIRHDARVMAFLDALPVDSPRVLCTWDRRFLTRHDQSRHNWMVLDAIVLSDLMALASGGEGMPLASPVALVSAANTGAEESAARVWDWLAEHSRANLSDAKTRRAAKAFVNTYVNAKSSVVAPSQLETAWNAWRAEEMT